MPTDLYIPPDALEVFLETFEGPLDLLLYLIRKQNFNIFDIPLAQVTRQYLDYVDQIRKHNLELASEYLLMAAMLIEIKSRMLLPPKPTADGAEPEDPRAELVRRLLEYEQIKLAAAQLDALPLIGRDFLPPRSMEHCLVSPDPDVSHRPAQGLARRDAARQLNQHHHIWREQLSVREHMSKMLRRLQGERFVEFPDCSTPRRAHRDGGDLHRDAGALARAPARGDAGRSLRADLRAAGLLAGAMSHARPPEGPCPRLAEARAPGSR